MTTEFDDSNDTPLLKRVADITAEPQEWLLPIEGHDDKPLVSLDEAIKPLILIVSDVKRKAYIAKKSRQRYIDALTHDESASIALYTMEWPSEKQSLYYCLNQSLRDKERENLKPWFLYLKLFLTALNKLPSVHSTVYRGVKKDLIGEYQPNSTAIWWGFSSCTTNIGILQSEKFFGKEGDRTLFAIECSSGKNISQHSYYRRENEILLPPARYFQVIARLDQGNGSHFVQLRETESPIVLMQPVSVEINLSPLSHDGELGSSSSTFDQSAKFERYQSLTNVNLTFENLIDDDIPSIVSHIIMFDVCTILDLSTNQITSGGVSIIARALRKNTTLKELSLANNHVCDEGIRFLMETLTTYNSTLTTLGLGSNDVSDVGAEYLARVLESNQILQILTLQHNQISNHGLELLMNALAHSNRGLKILNVSFNGLIMDDCIDSVIKMLNVNQTLRELYMARCNLSTINQKNIQQAAKRKKGFSFHA